MDPKATQIQIQLRTEANELYKLLPTPQVEDRVLNWYMDVDKLIRAGHLTQNQLELQRKFVERMQQLFPNVPQPEFD